MRVTDLVFSVDVVFKFYFLTKLFSEHARPDLRRRFQRSGTSCRSAGRTPENGEN
jgi:hypothetical protein